MAKPIVILHGWSDSASSFQRLGRFLRKELDRPVEDINLADWLSLEDEVTYADLRQAMQTAWVRKGLPITPKSVDVVVHSTGALVVRDWMTTFWDPDTVPIHRFLMLAPANYGSPLAHKGRAFYSRIIKGWRTGLQTGTKLLKGLELASPYTWELAHRDVLSEETWYGGKGILSTVLVGNKGYSGVRAAANEDGGDGTVRVSTANLNAAKLTLDLSGPTANARWHIPGPARSTAFGIIPLDSHGSITMKKLRTPRTPAARQLILGALQVEPADWGEWQHRLATVAEDATRDSMSASGTPKRDTAKHAFQNTVVHVTDDLGQSVPDYFVEFRENDTDTDPLGQFFHRTALRTVHAYCDDSSYRSFYVDVTQLHCRIDQEEESLAICLGAEPLYDDGPRSVGYRGTRSFLLCPTEVKRMFAPHRTLFVDVKIHREIAEGVFAIGNVR